MEAGPTKWTASSRKLSTPTRMHLPPRKQLPTSRPCQATRKQLKTNTRKHAGTPRPRADLTGHKLTSKISSKARRWRHHRGNSMSLLRNVAFALLVASATSAAPVSAAPLFSSTAPTMEDVDPGVDNTGREREVASQFRRQ